MYDVPEEVINSTSKKTESVNELLDQLESLFCDPDLPQTDSLPVKVYKRDDPARLLDDLQSLYLSSGQLSPEKAHHSNSSLPQSQKKITEQRSGLDVEEDELWSASSLNKSRQLKSKQSKKMSSSAAWSTAYDYNQPTTNECLNSIPTIGGNAPERTANNREQGSQGQGFGPPQSMSPNNLDLASLYFNTPQQPQQYPQSNYFAGGQQQQRRGRGGSYNRSQYSNGGGQYNNGWSSQGQESHNQQMHYSRGPGMYTSQNEPEGKLNPYANEFNPVFNAPQNNHNHYANGPPSYAPPQYQNHHQQHHQQQHHPRGQYKEREQQPNRRSYAVQIEAPEEPTSEIPEGATTVNMPHIYLGKFMMSRGDFETEHGVTITTKSQDGGYLIIIVGEKAAEAGAELEKMWNEEPIRSSDDIIEGKVIIKVAPDRWEGVVCFPMEHYAKLLAKRNEVETKHKVRILVKFLPDHSRYRATIRANKKELATEASDDLEALIMEPDATPPS